jgi:hypothetical protein
MEARVCKTLRLVTFKGAEGKTPHLWGTRSGNLNKRPFRRTIVSLKHKIVSEESPDWGIGK